MSAAPSSARSHPVFGSGGGGGGDGGDGERRGGGGAGLRRLRDLRRRAGVGARALSAAEARRAGAALPGRRARGVQVDQGGRVVQAFLAGGHLRLCSRRRALRRDDRAGGGGRRRGVLRDDPRRRRAPRPPRRRRPPPRIGKVGARRPRRRALRRPAVGADAARSLLLLLRPADRDGCGRRSTLPREELWRRCSASSRATSRGCSRAAPRTRTALPCRACRWRRAGSGRSRRRRSRWSDCVNFGVLL